MSRIQSRSLLDVRSFRATDPNTTRLVSDEFCPRKSSSRSFRTAVASLRALRIAGQLEPREDSSRSSVAPLSGMKCDVRILRRCARSALIELYSQLTTNRLRPGYPEQRFRPHQSAGN